MSLQSNLGVRRNRHFAKGSLPSHLNFVYSLAILAIKRHFCHFRQNRHFAKGPFAISFEFLFIVWRFWRLSAISVIFANACISGHISTNHPKENGWFVSKQHTPRIPDRKNPNHWNKNKNFKEFTNTRVIFCPFHPKKISR